MKSHANGPLSRIAACILKDAAAWCGVGSASVNRDLMEIKSRVEHEGLSFLTITLPNFSQAFERALERKTVVPYAFGGFQRRKCLPAFLSGFTELVFDPGTGDLLQDPSVESIRAIRQLCLFAKKIRLACTRERERKAIDGYIEVERSFRDTTSYSLYFDVFAKVSEILWPSVFRDFDEVYAKLLPKHGPGATEEKLSGNRKYLLRRWHQRLERIFPIDSYMFANASCMVEEDDFLQSVELVQEESERPVRVTLVPKTLKAPRIIAIEPVCMQYTQQALFSYLRERLESNWMTRGHVNFTDQSVNRSLALESSKTRHLATLDMSAASDRVPLEHVKTMLRGCPTLLDALLCSRSSKALLPNGEVIHLKKFASMGSATCFPIESIYFLTVVISALLVQYVLPYTLSSVLHVIKSIYVYGDDIIVPTDATPAVIEALTSLGNKVNTDKSFWNGHFRESCGMDAYNGSEVTPTYVRHPAPRDRRCAAAIISWVATSNLFYRSGYWQTSRYIADVVESVIGTLPILRDDSAGIGLVSFQRYLSIHGWHSDYQVPYVRCFVPAAVRVRDNLDGYRAMLKCFLELERSSRRSPLEPLCLQEDHLAHTARHGASSIKRRRIPVI